MTGHRKFSEIRTDRGDPEREARVQRYREELRHAMSLSELRRARELTQAQLGAALEMPQSAVSRLERQTDLYVSTLRSYVEAMGGQLLVEAVFPDKRILIGTFSSLADDESERRPDDRAGRETAMDALGRELRRWLGQEAGGLAAAARPPLARVV